MKTYILIILLSGQEPGVYFTQHCDQHIRTVNELMPGADAYCVAPSYSMRPVARPVSS